MGEGIPLPRWGTFLDFGGTKTRLWVHYTVSEIVRRYVYDCGSRDHEGELFIAYVIICLDIRVWEGDTASQDKNFSEIWVLKLRGFRMHKVKFHTHKIPNFAEASFRIPDFSYGILRVMQYNSGEAVSKIWANPKHKMRASSCESFSPKIILLT